MEEIDHMVYELVNALTSRATEASMPKASPSEGSAPEWTQECKEAQTTARPLRGRYQRTSRQADEKARREARNYKPNI
jgi:hypothetical protein